MPFVGVPLLHLLNLNSVARSGARGVRRLKERQVMRRIGLTISVLLICLAISSTVKSETIPNWLMLSDALEHYFYFPTHENAEAVCCLIQEYRSFYIDSTERSGWAYEDKTWAFLERLDYEIVVKNPDAVAVTFHIAAVASDLHLSSALSYELGRLLRVDARLFLAEAQRMPKDLGAARWGVCATTAEEGGDEGAYYCQELRLRRLALMSVHEPELKEARDLAIAGLDGCLREECKDQNQAF
jgi:hypothetical protein